jgi:putative phosphoribosyl transferase
MGGLEIQGGEGRMVHVPVGEVIVEGDFTIPPDPRGQVIFAHGSGSSRFSPRNRAVAARLQRAGQATLLLDLLTPEEEALDLRTRQYRFDIDLLVERVLAAEEWLAAEPSTHGLKIGLFGSSTGAAAALIAAAKWPDLCAAVVSRGGRADLAGDYLEEVRAPTLLIVGGADDVVLDLNREALARIPAKKRLEVIPGATHLFEEPGALDEVARLAAEWFSIHLAAAGAQLPRAPA